MSKREKKREWKACLNETVKGITQEGRERGGKCEKRERERKRERKKKRTRERVVE